MWVWKGAAPLNSDSSLPDALCWRSACGQHGRDAAGCYAGHEDNST